MSAKRASAATGKAFLVDSLSQVNRLTVRMNDDPVGTLAQVHDGRVAFEYDASWLANGFSISPMSLPLERRVFVADMEPFGGLFGVFNDSLPDGWGALLLDRMLRERGCDPREVSQLARLAIVGSSGRGALRYEPQISVASPSVVADLDALAQDCKALLNEAPVADLDGVYAAGGSSGGARPKAYVEDDGSLWLVKFPSSYDPDAIALIESEYSLCAQACGIEMARTRLFSSKVCDGYFGTERFDRTFDGRGIHMVTASGMLEVTHRLPLLDYDHLFKVTLRLTNDMEQVWQLYRLMCFNVFAHNQDDHSNNFAWLCEEGCWRLSPAYDLTYSTSYSNEHATTVNGSGRPDMNDVLSVAERFGLSRPAAQRVAEEIRARCEDLLARLPL